MGYYIISIAVFMLCGLAGYSVYRSHYFEKKMANRMDLVVRASHTCASRMNSACEKLDSMQAERKQNFDHQKKVSEHQRVLLASLNRQIQQLDVHLASGDSNLSGEREYSSSRISNLAIHASKNTLRTSIGKTIDEASKISKSRNGIVRLEEMFRNQDMDDEPVRNVAIHAGENSLPVSAPSLGPEVESRRLAHG